MATVRIMLLGVLLVLGGWLAARTVRVWASRSGRRALLSSKIASKLGMLANIGVLCFSLTASVVLFKIVLLTSNSSSRDQGISIGQKVKIDGLSPSADTIIIALRVGCHFCSNSAPLYQDLADRARGKGRNLIALFPDPPDEARLYLESLGVRVEDVRQVPFEKLGVAGTPTLFVVAPSGIVKKVWHGEQPKGSNARLLDTVFN